MIVLLMNVQTSDQYGESDSYFVGVFSDQENVEIAKNIAKRSSIAKNSQSYFKEVRIVQNQLDILKI